MKRLVVVSAIALTGCLSDPPPSSFVAPDGRAAFSVNCSQGGMTACYTAAREACGGNYEILQAVDATAPISNARTGQIISVADQRIYVACASGPHSSQTK